MPVDDGEGTADGDRTRQAMLIAGGCSAVLGIAALLWPGRDEAMLAVLFGTALLLGAVVQGYLAMVARIAVLLRLLVLASTALTIVLAVLAFSGGNIELLALWIGIGWAVRGIVQALVAAWDEHRADSWLHEICGLCTTVAGLTVIAMKFQTVTGLANVAGCALLVIGVLELLSGGMLRSVLGAARRPHAPSTALPDSAATER